MCLELDLQVCQRMDGYIWIECLLFFKQVVGGFNDEGRVLVCKVQCFFLRVFNISQFSLLLFDVRSEYEGLGFEFSGGDFFLKFLRFFVIGFFIELYSFFFVYVVVFFIDSRTNLFDWGGWRRILILRSLVSFLFFLAGFCF